MIFNVLLTPPDPGMRRRLAEQLRRVVHPADVIAYGRATFRFKVGENEFQQVRADLKRDILPWGADITEEPDLTS